MTLAEMLCFVSGLRSSVQVLLENSYQRFCMMPHCETFPLKCLFLEQSHPWSNLNGASGVDRENLGYFRMQITAVLRKSLMCTSSSDIISSANTLFLSEAVYITFQQCVNPDVFIWKGCNVKKQHYLLTARMKKAPICVSGTKAQQRPPPVPRAAACSEPWFGGGFVITHSLFFFF